MKFQTPYTITDAWSAQFATVNDEPSLTQQSDAMNTDINVIMKRYEQTGQLPQMINEALYGDFSNVPDYRTAVETINAANQAFLDLPPLVRQKFNHDPQQFIEFCSNEANKDELAKLGLTKPKREPTIEEQTLDAIRDLKPKETNNGTGQK